MQCAAVSTLFGATNDPPHPLNPTIHSYVCGLTSVPPTIRVLIVGVDLTAVASVSPSTTCVMFASLRYSIATIEPSSDKDVVKKVDAFADAGTISAISSRPTVLHSDFESQLESQNVSSP